MDDIGVIGAGLAGLHLSLFLQRHGVPVTLYAERQPDQVRAGRIPNTAAHWANTRARERELGVNFWDGVAPDSDCFHFFFGPPLSLWFHGNHERPGVAVDQRVSVPRLQEEFESRGGRVVYAQVQAPDLGRLSEQHDLVVVSSGRGSLAELFPRLPEHSPHTKPQRLICTGLFDGLTYPDPVGVIFGASPGHGEIFVIPYHTLDGNVSTLFFEMVPGGGLAHLMELRYDEDPDQFHATILRALQEHFPVVLDYVDTAKLRLHRPLDVLQGAIIPTVRRAYARLDNGRYVLACGDVHVVNDPLLGQGANAASHAAFVVGQAIVDDVGVYDERFCARTEERLWEYLCDVTEWNNHFLQVPPPMNVAQYLVAASQHQPLADRLATNFAHPDRAWNIFSTPQRTEAFLRRQGVEPPVLAMPEPAPAG
jgi:2-polyprenyl-6-methoxyphenol hydroxylase-like FAD-dependent oxidoreductase